MMEASIIIPTRNRPELLAKCLRELLSQDTSCEIIVCDDSPGDETKTMLSKDFPGVIWQRGPHNGPGANRNAGARVAQGEWLIFSDDDCLPRPGYLAAYFAAFKNSSWKMGSVLAGPTFRMNNASASRQFESPYYVKPVGMPPSCNFAISRALFEKIGGFDERFTIAFEDTEFFSRLLHSGITIEFVPDAVVEHPLRPLPSASTLTSRWESRVVSSLDLGAKPWQLFWRIPKHVLGVILARLRDFPAAPGDGKAIRTYLMEYLLMLWRLPGWILRHSTASRSAFWAEQVRAGTVPPNFGL